MRRFRPTTRWTGAAVVRLLSGLIGSRLFLLAPPGQLGRYALARADVSFLKIGIRLLGLVGVRQNSVSSQNPLSYQEGL
jgi:hypothetical protein